MLATDNKSLQSFTSHRAIVPSGGASPTAVPTVTRPDGTAALPRGFKIDVAGNVNIRMMDDAVSLTSAYAAGVFHPCCPLEITQTGTTATGIVLGY
jgi:hypothetical protein